MVVVESYPIAVVMCVITMLCWGSWANTQKLATKEWRFQLFYWDYTLGILLLSLVLAFTLGSMGGTGRPFIEDLRQASGNALLYALAGGVVFNLANILLVAAIDIAGMSVAFPIGIGLALVEGTIINYFFKSEGHPVFVFLGVAGVAVAIVVNALAYRRLSCGAKVTGKGIGISIVAGLLMGLFFYLVLQAKVDDKGKYANPGLLSAYSALVVFSLGIFLSNFLWNTLVMAKPFVGDPVPFADYFRKGNPRLHLVGILGGIIWSIGMSFSFIASDGAGPAISYGLGQGATLVAAFWGVCIWKEFKGAPAGTGKLLNLMFASYLVGLALLIVAKKV
jgi:glucose uptake protein